MSALTAFFSRTLAPARQGSDGSVSLQIQQERDRFRHSMAGETGATLAVKLFYGAR